MQTETFQLLVDGVPYIVKTIPYDFNGEVRFRVSYNDGPEHIFTWNSELGRVAAIDDESSIMPDSLEQAISEKLQAIAG